MLGIDGTKNMMFNLSVIARTNAQKHEPQSPCVQPNRARWFEHLSAWPLRLLRFWHPWDDCADVSKPATGTCWVMGFGVIESPVGVRNGWRKDSKQGAIFDLADCSDAAAPVSIEAELIRNRVGFALPTPPLTSKHVGI